jgi:hypothetical protein
MASAVDGGRMLAHGAGQGPAAGKEASKGEGRAAPTVCESESRGHPAQVLMLEPRTLMGLGRVASPSSWSWSTTSN